MRCLCWQAYVIGVTSRDHWHQSQMNYDSNYITMEIYWSLVSKPTKFLKNEFSIESYGYFSANESSLEIGIQMDLPHARLFYHYLDRFGFAEFDKKIFKNFPDRSGTHADRSDYWGDRSDTLQIDLKQPRLHIFLTQINFSSFCGVWDPSNST